MSDDFGLSSDEEADLLAAVIDANGKHGHDDDYESTMQPNKRIRTCETSNREPSPSTVLANKVLKERFGLNGFRLEQEAAITRILDGGSAVVVFPTGGGKSLCYQVSNLQKSEALTNAIRFLLFASATRIRMLAATPLKPVALASSYLL
jgi:superfamily II DNA/RNA helicase